MVEVQEAGRVQVGAVYRRRLFAGSRVRVRGLALCEETGQELIAYARPRGPLLVATPNWFLARFEPLPGDQSSPAPEPPPEKTAGHVSQGNPW